MGKLGSIIGFSVLFLMFFTVVGSASVVGLRGGENQADPGSVGDTASFGRVLASQEGAAALAEKIATDVNGAEEGDAYEVYEKLVIEHYHSAICAACNVFVIVVMRESGADPNFPKEIAKKQYDALVDDSDKYQTFSIGTHRSDCRSIGVDTPKRGDLLYRIETGKPSHTGVYLGQDNGNHRIAQSSIGRNAYTPKIVTRQNIGFECGARLKGLAPPAAQPQTSKAISAQ